MFSCFQLFLHSQHHFRWVLFPFSFYVSPQQKFTLSFYFYISWAFHLCVWTTTNMNTNNNNNNNKRTLFFLSNSGPLCCDFVLFLQRRSNGSSEAKVESSIFPTSGKQLHGNSSIGKISLLHSRCHRGGGENFPHAQISSVICTIAFLFSLHLLFFFVWSNFPLSLWEF